MKKAGIESSGWSGFLPQEGETIALVGESGCGKSVTSLAILRLVDSDGKIQGGKILLKVETYFLFQKERCEKSEEEIFP